MNTFYCNSSTLKQLFCNSSNSAVLSISEIKSYVVLQLLNGQKPSSVSQSLLQIPLNPFRGLEERGSPTLLREMSLAGGPLSGPGP